MPEHIPLVFTPLCKTGERTGSAFTQGPQARESEAVCECVCRVEGEEGLERPPVGT